MKRMWQALAIILGLVVLYTAGHLIYGAKLEKPNYDVLKKADGYEVRRYQDFVIAEVDSDKFGDVGQDLNDEFMKVGGYIFGDNKAKESEGNQKIAMTAPVFDAYEGKESRTVSFVMPAEWSLDNLPVPNNEAVRLRKVDPMVVAVKTVRGSYSQKKYQRGVAELRQQLTADDIQYTEKVTLAYYDPPSAPWFIRKTDILVELKVDVEADYTDQKIPENAELATLAGGCFWCIEAPYDNLDGVYAAISGYAGGDEADAKYNLVASGQTEHKEAVQVYYDPVKLTYEDILKIFWRQIDPTDAGGQFADRGPQYKTAIFYHNDEQKQLAEKTKADLAASGKFDGNLVTEVLPFKNFFEAEAKHQNFAQKQAAYYQRYKYGSGRGKFLEENWGG